MATTEWIDSASLPPRRPVGGSNLTMVSALLAMPKGKESAERKEHRRSARYVLRKAADDPDRDLLLEAIGRTYEEAAPLPSEGAEPLPDTAPAVRTKRCTGCEELKDLEEFPRRSNASDRRISRCRQCRNDHSRAYRIAEKEAGQ